MVKMPFSVFANKMKSSASSVDADGRTLSFGRADDFEIDLTGRNGRLVSFVDGKVGVSVSPSQIGYMGHESRGEYTMGRFGTVETSDDEEVNERGTPCMMLEHRSPSSLRMAISLLEKGNCGLDSVENELVGLCKAYYWLAEFSENREDKDMHLQVSKSYGSRACKRDKDSTAAMFWYASSLVDHIQYTGLFEVAPQYRSAKSMLQKIIQKDPSYENYGAYRLLGRLYRMKLPWHIGFHHDGKAIKLLRSACVESDCPINRLALGTALLEKKSSARDGNTMLNSLLRSNSEGCSAYELDHMKKKARLAMRARRARQSI